MAFQNRVAVVTGAAGGIGTALCKKLLENSVSVALTDYKLDLAEQTVNELGGASSKLHAYQLNVTDMASIRTAYQNILADFGKVDILVNNAGAWPGKPFTEMTEEEWLSVVDLNLNSVFRVSRVFVENMLQNGYGRIINLGSIAGEVGLPGRSHYSASKAGVIMLTKTLAMELAKRNITVNSVSPGMVAAKNCPLFETKTTWLERNCHPSEIARAIIFLADDDSSFITGVDFTVDGGRILGPRFADFP